MWCPINFTLTADQYLLKSQAMSEPKLAEQAGKVFIILKEN